MSATALEAALLQPITAKLVLPTEPGAASAVIRRVALPQCRFAGLLKLAERVAAEHGISGPVVLVDTQLQRRITDDFSLLFSVQHACLDCRCLKCEVFSAEDAERFPAASGPGSMERSGSLGSSSLLMSGSAVGAGTGAIESGVQRPMTMPIAGFAVPEEPISTAGVAMHGVEGLLLSAAVAPVLLAESAAPQPQENLPPELLQITPFDAVCLKHVQKHLLQLQAFYLQQLQELYARESQMMHTQRQEAEFMRESAIRAGQPDSPELKQRLAEMERRLQAEVDLARARHRHKIRQLADEYDHFLEDMAPERFLKPLQLRISIASLRDCNFELVARPGETFDGLRHLIMDRMEQLGLPIGEFGVDSMFAVFPSSDTQTGNASGSGGGGKKSSGSLFSFLFRGQPQPQQRPTKLTSPTNPFGPMPAELRQRFRPNSPKPQRVQVQDELNTRLRDLGVTDNSLIVLLGQVALRGERLGQSMTSVEPAAAAPLLSDREAAQPSPSYVPGAWALDAVSAESPRPQHPALETPHPFFSRPSSPQEQQHQPKPQLQQPQQQQQHRTSPAVAAPEASPLAADDDAEFGPQLRQLRDMGFSDPQDLAVLREALRKTGGDIERAIARLLS